MIYKFLQGVWQRIRLGVIIVLSVIIGISYTIAIPIYQEMRKEADRVWSEHIERIENKDGTHTQEKGDGGPVKAEPTSTPDQSAGEETKNFSPSSGSIEELIKKTWNNEEEAKIAIAVAKSESHLNPQSIGDKHLKFYKDGKEYGASYGIFQIRHLQGRPDPSQLLDPEFNVRYAYELFCKSGFSPWSQFKNKRYLTYM